MSDLPFNEQVQEVPMRHSTGKRSRKSAKSAGARFEQSIASWLAKRLGSDFIERRTKNGRNDRGDIAGVKTIRGGRCVIEAKDYGGSLQPSTWLKEAEIEAGNDDAPIGVVIAKRKGTTNPADQFCLMTVETFARLLEGGPDELRF